MESKKVFLVSIIQEGKFFVARCPELGVTSQGESLVEAQKNLKEAIELYIESFGLAKGTLLDVLHQTGLNENELIELLK